MNVRIIVADEREANFYDTVNAGAALQASGSLINEAGRLQDQELESDRPGRAMNRIAGSRHALGEDRSAHRQQMTRFAKEVAQTLHGARTRHEYDRLVLIAGPRMLGLLREALPDGCRADVAAEIPKDLVHEDAESIRSAIPREVFLN